MDFEIEILAGCAQVVGEPRAGLRDALRRQRVVQFLEAFAHGGADIAGRRLDGDHRRALVFCLDDLRRLDTGW